MSGERSEETPALAVSVVIPCYNHGQFLEEAVTSVLRQTHPAYEIIVIDDGSSDDTAVVADGLPIRYVEQPHQGLSAARNHGLRLSAGDVLVFLDADDRLLPSALHCGLTELAARPNCAFVSGQHRLVGPDGAVVDEPPVQLIQCDHYIQLLQRNYIGMHATVMYRREILQIVGGFDESLAACEDYDLYLRIARHWPIHCHANVVAEYRRHGSNMSNNTSLMIQTATRVLKAEAERVRGNAPYEEACAAGLRFITGFYNDVASWPAQLHVTTDSVEPHFYLTNEHLWGAHVERPIPGVTTGSALAVSGWVVGRSSPAVAVEILNGSRLCLTEPVALHRPDVSTRYPQAPGSRRSGFHAWIQLTGMGEHHLVVNAVLADHTRATIARLRVRVAGGPRLEDAPLVSVVIACYNQGRFLRDAIESVLHQTHTNCEIVVVDDGSDDNSEEIARSYSRTICLRQDNRGLAAARNRGFAATRGSYIIFLDADDRLAPHAVETALTEFRALPDCAFVAGRHRTIDVDGRPLETPRMPLIRAHHYRELLCRNFIAVPGAVMFRRDALPGDCVYDAAFHPCEDYDLYLRLARAYPVHCHEHVVVEYRRHDASLSRSPAAMLTASLAVLRSNHAGPHRRRDLKRAFEAGRRYWRDHYGEELVRVVRDSARRADWKAAVRLLPTLLRYYPRSLLRALGPRPGAARMREIVATVLPLESVIAVVTNGDEPLPFTLGTRIRRLSDFNPHDAITIGLCGSSAVLQVESARALGVDYLLIPRDCFWWFERYRGFATHLAERYRCCWSDDRCAIFTLRQTGDAEAA